MQVRRSRPAAWRLALALAPLAAAGAWLATGALEPWAVAARAGGGAALGSAPPPTRAGPPSCPPDEARPRVHVAPHGDDAAGDGTAGAPWATITHALRRVPDGAVVVVAAGTYTDRVRLTGRFDRGVLVCSRRPYRATLRGDGGATVTAYGNDGPVHGITLQGFEITHAGPDAGPLVVHLDGAGAGRVRNLELRDNVLHDSADNDLLKINHRARDVRVAGNLFYNQAGPDEHIDVNGAEGVTIEDNLFFNDFAGSGRANRRDTGSFVVIKDSNGADDGRIGSRGVTVRRNVFLHWQGSPGAYFVLVGEDGAPYFEAQGVLVENNLLLGDGPDPMRAPFGVKGARDVTFRHNTVVGDLPARAFGVRLNTEGANPPNERIRFHGNVWADPTGTMGATGSGGPLDFADAPPGETASFELRGNLYWNGGTPLPDEPGELLQPRDDPRAVVGDPRLPDPRRVPLPRWDRATGSLEDGSLRIADARARLLRRFGTPGAGGAARDAADPATAPREDALGRTRGPAPDLGALER